MSALPRRDAPIVALGGAAPGMQMVIFREIFIAVTILAPRPRAWRNVREPCSIEQSDEKYRFKRGTILTTTLNFHSALDLAGRQSP